MQAGYGDKENFLSVIEQAKITYDLFGNNIPDHFPDVRKTIYLGAGSKRGIDTIIFDLIYISVENHG